MTGAFQTAVNGFQGAQQKQAQTNAIVNQVVATIVAIGAAGLAEPFLAAALGSLGTKLEMTAEGVPKLVETLENPLNAFAAGASSTGAAAAGVSDTNAGQTPNVGPSVAGGAGGGGAAAADPVGFLSANLGTIESYNQKFEGAFATLASEQSTLLPDAWAHFDPAARRAAYDKQIADIDAAAPSSAEALKDSGTLAIIIERFLWAAWIKANVVEKGFSIKNFGTDIEDRLNAIGVSAQAGVYLSGHWYIPNSVLNTVPGKLYDWAAGYKEALTQGK